MMNGARDRLKVRPRRASRDTKKVTLTEDMTPAEKVRLIDQVRPLPRAASEVMQLCNVPDPELPRIAAAVAQDAALAAQVLSMANSAAFGARRQVETVEQAVSMVGARRMGHVAASMAMLGAMRSTAEEQLPFYSTALTSAGFSQFFCASLGENKSVGFIAGLLCEIGAMACASVDPEGYLALYDSAADEATLRLREAERYDKPAPTIGAELLERNGLPELVCESVGCLGVDDSTLLVARIVGFSREVVRQLSRELGEDWLGPLGDRYELGVTSAQLLELTEQAKARMQKPALSP